MRSPLAIASTTVIAAAFIACAADSESPEPNELAVNRSAPRDAGGEPSSAGDDSGTAIVRDGGARGEPAHYAGILTATKTVPFGGGANCNYRVTMKDVSMEIEVDEHVVSAKVENTMVEEVVGACGNSPSFPNLHMYSLPNAADGGVTSADAGADAGSLEHLVMTGRGTNGPRTRLTVDLVREEAGYTANLTWKRDDKQAAPLMWTVTGKLTLTKN
jgi:hypothetical protein